MATSDRIKERIAVFARELSEELGEVDESLGVCWLDAIENQAIEIEDALHAELVKQKSLHQPAADEAVCPECGKVGRYRGKREREFITRRGPATIAEPEYYCPACRRAFFPADHATLSPESAVADEVRRVSQTGAADHQQPHRIDHQTDQSPGEGKRKVLGPGGRTPPATDPITSAKPPILTAAGTDVIAN